MIGRLVLAALLTQAPATPSPSPPAPVAATTETAKAPTLSELHAAKVEAHAAKSRALQYEMRLRELALLEERRTLDAALTAAHPGYRMDWERGELVAAGKDPQ